MRLSSVQIAPVVSLLWTACVAQSSPTAQSWDLANAAAQALVEQMTADEQANLTYGQSGSGCSGMTGSVPRFGVPGLCFQDAGNGVRGTDFVNAYAAGISVAASWNKRLAEERGLYMGAEFKRKGAHAANGPVVGPIGRVAEAGRAFEAFGSDPYLSGQLAARTIIGLQQNVMSVVKHFILNEQETGRLPFGNRTAVSSNVDDRTVHELYLWPFQDAVHANVASVMTAYNRINRTFASEDQHTLTDLLKNELAFPGFVVSDWGAQHSGAASANAGLDIAMPNSQAYWADGQLQKLVSNGTVPADRLRDMARRILASWYQVIGGPTAPFPAPGVGLPAELNQPHDIVEARDPASKPNILQSAIEGHVLVKNTNSALPLSKPKLLSLYGYDALVPQIYNPASPQIVSKYIYGLSSVNITIAEAAPILAGGEISNPPQAARLGLLWNGVGSGANNPSALSDTYSAIQRRARADDTFLLWDFASLTPDINPVASACLVFINEGGSEGIDRPGLADPASDLLVANVASKCNNTIVSIHNGGIRTVDAWIENPNVTAVIFAHYPGQDAGEALAQILYGEVSPSGRLPYTVPKKEADLGYLLGPCRPTSAQDTAPQCHFYEGIFTDYRHYLAYNITPRFHFGYGLSYSAFEYADFQVSWLASPSDPALATIPPQPEVRIPGGIASLFTPLARAQVTVRNTGARNASAVPQIYVEFPHETPGVHFLRGFDKVALQPGESQVVTFNLTRRDLSRWSVDDQMWHLFQGAAQVKVGSDAHTIQAATTLSR